MRANLPDFETMSHGWSPSDKAVAKNAADRARRRAEEEALKLYSQYKVNTVDDLWALELQIRDWRKARQRAFTLNFQIADEQLVGWLAKGWLRLSDLTRLSPERLEAIQNKK